MIVYHATKEKFLADVLTNTIEKIVLAAFEIKLGKSTSTNEIKAWKNSLQFMNNVLHDPGIPSDASVAIEYQIPQTSKRIDFVITGKNETGNDQAVIIELKQWSSAEMTLKDGVVKTYVGNAEREVSHPSYQVWSYAMLLRDFNETVYEQNIELRPCAYLHNYEEDGVINNAFYKQYLDKAPLFLQADAQKLRDFIKTYIKTGDSSNIIARIDNGKLKPSKSLADNMADVLTNTHEFVMIDEQKVVYETVLALAKEAASGKKQVLIVQGGPGTGKSVVAINLLVAFTRERLNARYVTKNAAPRAVYEYHLQSALRKSQISELFSGSGAFIDNQTGDYDVLLIDEAHRLNAKSGMMKNLGENQVKEIINAAKLSVFFIDEDQKVTWHDIGDSEEIEKWAAKAGAVVHKMELTSQFRCNGSDGYLAWLDQALQIKETANTTLDPAEYDFRVVDSPNELRDLIFEKNKINNKARLVAGYCWDWISKKNPNLMDINIPEHNFKMKWNLNSDGNLWIIGKESVNEVGCIHSSQGLEVDYVGVIVGPDLIVRDGKVITQPEKRAKTDQSLKGYKKDYKANPKLARERADAIIKNTYRTLMTRGMKGCYVYFVDEETKDYFLGKYGKK